MSFWTDGLRMGAESPFIGVGLQCFGSRAYSNPHNEFVFAWAKTGFSGAIPFAFVLFGCAALVIRSLASVRLPTPRAPRRRRPAAAARVPAGRIHGR